MFSCTMLHRSNGDVRIFQPPVVLWIPATVLDKIPGVGLGAAGSGHAPDRHLQLSLPKLWHGRPSALQPESPGLCPCCRQRGVHPLPESQWAQVGRWVLISAHGEVFSPNKRYTKGFDFVVAEVLKGLGDLWRSRGLLKAREMMDMLFEFAWVVLLTKPRGGTKRWIKLQKG